MSNKEYFKLVYPHQQIDKLIPASPVKDKAAKCNIQVTELKRDDYPTILNILNVNKFELVSFRISENQLK